MDDIKILHISDTHFGAHDERKRSALVEYARDFSPDVVVLTGDVLDSPLRLQSSLKKAKAFLSTIKGICNSNLFCVPGNHDALLGSRFLKQFWDELQEGDTNFVSNLNIRGQSVCIVGVDTTCWYLPHLNNSGFYSNVTEQKLLAKLQKLGHKINLKNAFIIALAHHHPIPTTTAAAEGMLYFKNSGQFLRFATKHGIKLILHGHQHDPHFAKISFGSDHVDDMIGILSAGSCMKIDENEEDFSGCGHFYSVRIDKRQTIVTSFYYHRDPDRFIAENRYVISRNIQTLPQLKTVDQTFTVAKNGDMKAVNSGTFRRTKDGESTIRFALGVDERSRPCRLEELQISVKIDGKSKSATCIEDNPFTKRFEVSAGEGSEGQIFKITTEYTWPGGFQRFLQTGEDFGEFQIVGLVEWCRVTIALDDPNLQLRPLKVIARGEIHHAGDGRRQLFTVDRPHGLISWSAETTTAPPPSHV